MRCTMLASSGLQEGVPEQQKILRRIKILANEGLSPYRISADLATRDVKLSHVTVRKIIAGRLPSR